MSRFDVSGQTALITGASTGIGRELALLLARDKCNLVLVARNQSALETLCTELSQKHGVTARALAMDLSDPAAPGQIAQALQVAGIRVDILINNAGFGSQGPFASSDLATQMGMVQVNISALTQLTGLFLSDMVARNSGRVMNVASTAAFQPGPLMAVYFASKAYVLSFSEAIDDELRKTAVRVTALCPGPTKTEFQKRGNISKTRVFKGDVMDAATVARQGYEGMLAGRRVVINGLRNRMLVAAVRMTPRRLVTTIARKLNQAK